MFIYFVSLIIFFVADRLSKFFIVNKTPDFLGGFISFELNENLAFSLPMMDYILYPLVLIVIVIVVNLWLKAYQNKNILIWPWGLLIIGAVSNLLDRFQYGGVVDFINVPYFTVFNISDIYISIAVVWILWYELAYKKKLDKKST
ncbi:signal peptidase II [Candidatus Parcubacteria bacterium]|nr:MAG: signal peptidase II [Candidatus Parcubacteria bacterium]